MSFFEPKDKTSPHAAGVHIPAELAYCHVTGGLLGANAKTHPSDSRGRMNPGQFAGKQILSLQSSIIVVANSEPRTLLAPSPSASKLSAASFDTNLGGRKGG